MVQLRVRVSVKREWYSEGYYVIECRIRGTVMDIFIVKCRLCGALYETCI